MGQARGFRQLRVWQRGDELACAVFQAVNRLHAKHGWLASQTARAALSVPANIAEGYSRGGLKEYVRFLDIARGSLGELEYYIHFLHKNGLLGAEPYQGLMQLHLEVGNLLFRLIQALREKLKQGEPWDRSLVIREEAGVYTALGSQD